MVADFLVKRPCRDVRVHAQHHAVSIRTHVALKRREEGAANSLAVKWFVDKKSSTCATLLYATIESLLRTGPFIYPIIFAPCSATRMTDFPKSTFAQRRVMILEQFPTRGRLVEL